MRSAVSLLAGLLLGFLPSVAVAGCTNSDCSALKGLSAVRILVQGLDEGAKQLGLTKKGLEDLALVALRTRLPRVKVASWSSFAPFIFIRVTGIRQRLVSGEETFDAVAFVEVQLLHKAQVSHWEHKGRKVWVYGMLWTSGGFLLGGRLPKIRARIQREIADALTAFAADWNRANPRK